MPAKLKARATAGRQPGQARPGQAARYRGPFTEIPTATLMGRGQARPDRTCRGRRPVESGGLFVLSAATRRRPLGRSRSHSLGEGGNGTPPGSDPTSRRPRFGASRHSARVGDAISADANPRQSAAHSANPYSRCHCPSLATSARGPTSLASLASGPPFSASPDPATAWARRSPPRHRARDQPVRSHPGPGLGLRELRRDELSPF